MSARTVRLRRERPGLYSAEDGRFTVQGQSGAWTVLDLRPTNGEALTAVGFPSSLADARTRIASVLDREAAR